MEELLNKAKQRISNAESQRRVMTAHGTKDLPLGNKWKPWVPLKTRCLSFSKLWDFQNIFCSVYVTVNETEIDW